MDEGRIVWRVKLPLPVMGAYAFARSHRSPSSWQVLGLAVSPSASTDVNQALARAYPDGRRTFGDISSGLHNAFRRMLSSATVRLRSMHLNSDVSFRFVSNLSSLFGVYASAWLGGSPESSLFHSNRRLDLA